MSEEVPHVLIDFRPRVTHAGELHCIEDEDIKVAAYKVARCVGTVQVFDMHENGDPVEYGDAAEFRISGMRILTCWAIAFDVEAKAGFAARLPEQHASISSHFAFEGELLEAEADQAEDMAKGELPMDEEVRAELARDIECRAVRMHDIIRGREEVQPLMWEAGAHMKAEIKKCGKFKPVVFVSENVLPGRMGAFQAGGEDIFIAAHLALPPGVPHYFRLAMTAPNGDVVTKDLLEQQMLLNKRSLLEIVKTILRYEV